MATIQAGNPWIPNGSTTPFVYEASGGVATTGAREPQPDVAPPEASDQLGIFTPSHSPRVWVIGTHGGSGESTMAALLGGADTGHRWPAVIPAPSVVLVARTHLRGLKSAQMAARTWASGHTPAVRLIGLILVADAPGKLPRELSDLATIVGGGVPHIWRFPWEEHLRLGGTGGQTSRQTQRVMAEINQLLNSTNGQGA